MSTQPRPSTAFENRSHGTQNANTGDGPQNNNNSTGWQYNIFGNAWISGSGQFDANQLQSEEDLPTGDNEILQSLAFPEMLDRRNNIEPRHGSTCQWILELEQYRTWMSNARGLLWIKGKPGAGKSTLMAFLHDELTKSPDASMGIRLEFFFTARGTELQRTPMGMLRSLTRQIFVHNESVRSKVREVYGRKCQQFGYGERKWEWQQRELENLLADCIQFAAERQQVTVFVDALDEAGRESAQALAAFFHQISARATQAKAAVKICISCRHYPIASTVPGIEVWVEHHNGKDIAAYVNDNLRPEELDAEDSSDKEAWTGHREELIKRAQGVFQWVHILTQLIQNMAQRGKSPQEVHDWLHQVPPELEGVYEYVFDGVIEPADREQSLLLFQWVCLAERPLTVTEISYAMAIRDAQVTPYRRRCQDTPGFVESNERMKRRIKALSGGLVEVNSGSSGDETVQVVHQSVNDFLQDKGLGYLARLVGANLCTGADCAGLDGREVVSQCQATLYRSCLIYLATENVTPIPDKPTGKSKDDKNRLLIQSPFLDYAATNLFIHAEKARGYRANVIEGEITLLQAYFDRWARIYRTLQPWLTYPRRGTSLLHMASAANLTDLVEHLTSAGEAMHAKDDNGETAFHAAARGGHVQVGEILYKNGADFEAQSNEAKSPLLEAACHGRVDFVEWLLNKGAKVNAPGRSGNPLQAAALGGRRQVVEILLAAGSDVNAQGGTYGNALQAASRGGHSEVVRMLLDAHADVNAQGGTYGNALQAASRGGHSEVVRMLLDAHADVNAQGGTYGNALQAASYGGHSEVVRMLLDAHADVNAQGGEYGNALQAASYRGYSEVVRMLLDAHADVNAQGGMYGNALQAASASYRGDSEVVRMLLDAHADVNAQGGTYGNALQAASLGGNGEVVRMLLDAHADVNAQGGMYGNALQAASASYRGDSEVVRMLLDADADVNTQGGIYGNALQAASNNGNSEVVRMLLDAHADVNAQGGMYGNALQAASASYRGDSEVVRMLLDAHADVNAQGGEYGTALLAAVNDCDTKIIQILLQSGANPCFSDHLGATPLHIAASRGQLDLLTQFPAFGASMNAQDKFLRTPLHLALYRGRVEFAIALLKNGADPLLLDCFGRNAMDWALGHDMLIDLLRNVCPAVALTRKETRIKALRQSVRELSAMLLHTGASASTPITHYLGRCLFFLGEFDSARYLFGLCSSTLICDAYYCPNRNSLFHCTVCADVKFCSSCAEQNCYHSRLCPSQRHELLEVSEVPQENQVVDGVLSEQLTVFLKGLMGQFGDPNSRPTEDCNLCHSPMADEQQKVQGNTELEHMDVASNIANGSQILVSFAVIGLSVVLMRSLYHQFR